MLSSLQTHMSRTLLVAQPELRAFEIPARYTHGRYQFHRGPGHGAECSDRPLHSLAPRGGARGVPVHVGLFPLVPLPDAEGGREALAPAFSTSVMLLVFQ